LEAKKPTKQPLDAKLETNLDTTGSQPGDLDINPEALQANLGVMEAVLNQPSCQTSVPSLAASRRGEGSMASNGVEPSGANAH
jgi:hypothetical protein